MYNIIKNPETNRNVSIYSKKGIAILEKYLNNLKGNIKLNPLKDTIPDDFRTQTYIKLMNDMFKIIKDSKLSEKENTVDLKILLKKIKEFPSSQGNSVTIEYLYRNMLYFFISIPDNKFIENLYNIHSNNNEKDSIYKTDLKKKINFFKNKYKFLKNIDINHLDNINLYKDNNDGGGVKNSLDGYIFRIHLTNIMSVLLILIKNLSDLKQDELSNGVMEKIDKLLVSKELNGQRGIVCTINSAKLIIEINIFLIDLFKKQENIFIFNDLFKDLTESIFNNNIK